MNLDSRTLRAAWILAGPTASGKSDLALLLAERAGAEILSMDSMAVYRHMDIGTAKPSAADRNRVPHHLIDLAEPHDEFTTAAWLQAASRAAGDILQRGNIPLFVGGTGLYLRALLRGLFEGPPADWDFRRDLEAEADRHPDDWLWNRLKQVDPQSAERLHPNDRRRLVRALEIHALTGMAASDSQQQIPVPEDQRPAAVLWLHLPRPLLARRIDQRVDRMLEQGLVEETRSLLSRNPPPGRTAMQALGYREIADWLQSRSGSLEGVRSLIQTRTRQFAKRQHTWFRNLEECEEFPVAEGEPPEVLCDRILKRARHGPDQHVST